MRSEKDFMKTKAREYAFFDICPINSILYIEYGYKWKYKKIQPEKWNLIFWNSFTRGKLYLGWWLTTAWIFYTRSRKTNIFHKRTRLWKNMDISPQNVILASHHRIMSPYFSCMKVHNQILNIFPNSRENTASDTFPHEL